MDNYSLTIELLSPEWNAALIRNEFGYEAAIINFPGASLKIIKMMPILLQISLKESIGKSNYNCHKLVGNL